MAFVTVAEFRVWAGANVPGSTPDQVIQDALNEAEAGLLADVGVGVDEISLNAAAISVARGDETRRASRLLARRNSPEGLAGAGAEGVIQISSRDPDSAASVRQIKALLLVPEGIY